jgi:hypothetical protein
LDDFVVPDGHADQEEETQPKSNKKVDKRAPVENHRALLNQKTREDSEEEGDDPQEIAKAISKPKRMKKVVVSDDEQEEEGQKEEEGEEGEENHYKLVTKIEKTDDFLVFYGAREVFPALDEEKEQICASYGVTYDQSHSRMLCRIFITAIINKHTNVCSFYLLKSNKSKEPALSLLPVSLLAKFHSRKIASFININTEEKIERMEDMILEHDDIDEEETGFPLYDSRVITQKKLATAEDFDPRIIEWIKEGCYKQMLKKLRKPSKKNSKKKGDQGSPAHEDNEAAEDGQDSQNGGADQEMSDVAEVKPKQPSKNGKAKPNSTKQAEKKSQEPPPEEGNAPEAFCIEKYIQFNVVSASRDDIDSLYGNFLDSYRAFSDVTTGSNFGSGVESIYKSSYLLYQGDEGDLDKTAAEDEKELQEEGENESEDEDYTDIVDNDYTADKNALNDEEYPEEDENEEKEPVEGETEYMDTDRVVEPESPGLELDNAELNIEHFQEVSDAIIKNNKFTTSNLTSMSKQLLGFSHAIERLKEDIDNQLATYKLSTRLMNHVSGIASDLIASKLETDQIKTENEGLKETNNNLKQQIAKTKKENTELKEEIKKRKLELEDVQNEVKRQKVEAATKATVTKTTVTKTAQPAATTTRVVSTTATVTSSKPPVKKPTTSTTATLTKAVAPTKTTAKTSTAAKAVVKPTLVPQLKQKTKQG